MFDRIVVPLDGSAFAEAALIPARELAERFGSKLLLTTALKPLGLPPVHGSEGVDADELGEADIYLNEQVEKLRKDGFAVDMTLYLADAGEAIAGTAELGLADLIVIATHMGWTLPAEGPRHSSVTLNLLARTRVPILSCHMVPAANVSSEIALESDRPSAPQLAGPELPIVVPLDGSPFAEQALPIARALAEAFGAYLVLVCALASAEPQGSGHGDLGQREARDYLAHLRDQLDAQGIRATTTAEAGVAINVIEHAWREHGAGMLVMASHGQSRHLLQQTGASGTSLPDALMGSVAAEILEELEVPTLVIQPEIPKKP
jgi:nucleotide-binding universal stress UspA family protein